MLRTSKLEKIIRIAKNLTSKLAFVNDITERGVKLIEEYNKVLANDELHTHTQTQTDIRTHTHTHSPSARSKLFFQIE